MKDSDVVENAIATLDKKGWVRGNFHTDQGVCVGYALSKFSSRDDDVEQYIRLAQRITNASDQGIIAWNDNAMKDYTEVRERLETVAKDLRNEGQ